MQNNANTTSNTITIIKAEPHRQPEIITINNTLEALQSLVEGHIEAVSLSPTACIIVNEEGKLIGLPPNRKFYHDILVGTILIVGIQGSEIVSLTSTEIKEYMEKFKHWEVML